MTLKMASRSPRSNQFFFMSQQYNCASLVKIHPFLHEIGCRQAIFIPRHTIEAEYYGFTLVVRVSVHLSFHPSAISPSVHFSFPDDNLRKHQWIFTKLGMCIDIVEIWFGIAYGQILSNFYRVICPRHAHIFVSGL